MPRRTAVICLVFACGCGSDAETPSISRAGIGLPLTSGELAEVEQQGPVRFRRLWAGGPFNSYASSPSPDGSFITDIDWDTGDLAILRFSTGGLERITDKGTWNESSDFAECSTVSPDGRRIAYAWVNADAGGYELRTINLDGSDVRVVAEVDNGIKCYIPRDWSDDGRWILTDICSSAGTTQIALISAEDGTLRVIKDLGWMSYTSLSISPDGRYVAYDFPPAAEAVARDVYVVPVDGSGESAIVQGEANDVLLGWVPDGSGLMYYSDRTIWRIPIEDGRAAGDAELVRSDVWNLVPLGFTDNSYLFGVIVEAQQVHTAVVDVEAGRTVRAPEPVSALDQRFTISGVWSPDGKHLAYLGRPLDQFATLLTIHGMETGEIQELLLRLGIGQYLQWAPDGEGMYVYGSGARDQRGVYHVDLRSGALELVAADHRSGMSDFALSPDGRSIYYRTIDPDDPQSRSPAGRSWIVARDLETGEVRRILQQQTHGARGRIGFSPDGTTLSYAETFWSSREFEIRVAPIEGGDPQTVYRFPEGTQPAGIHSSFEWTPDGRHILFIERDMRDTTVSIRALEIEGGDVKTLLVLGSAEADQGAGLQLSPDGRHVAFVAGNWRSEVWLMEGF